MAQEHKKLDFIDNTVQKTYEWLREIRDELRIDDSQIAYHGLSAVLHTLRDRLSPEVVAALSAQVPILIRGLLYDGWRPADKPLLIRHRDEFLELVEERFGGIGLVQPARLAHAVLTVLERNISPGLAENVKRSLPEEIRTLWHEEEAA